MLHDRCKLMISLAIIGVSSNLLAGCQGGASSSGSPGSIDESWAAKACQARYSKGPDLSTVGVPALEAACKDGVAEVAVHLKKTQGLVTEHSKALQQCEQTCAAIYIDSVDHGMEARRKTDQNEIDSPAVPLPEIDGETIEQVDEETPQERAAKPETQKVIPIVLEVGEITQACSESCADEWIRLSKPRPVFTSEGCVEVQGPGGMTRCE